MERTQLNNRKIFNDPVFGFISVRDNLIFEIIEHPYFQRLRRINQLGLTHLVYPGALHTRFHHALGAMFLMGEAVEILKSKGHDISEEEEQAVKIAVLLHDIGHGPFSHVLETSIVSDISHEYISKLFMESLNKKFGGKLKLAVAIFKNKYHKKFLHQLVSGQIDVDRLDYLKRDSFFTGVSEGVISTERILTMINVADDQLVIESKGIYSIEKFIVARRLMYWQVYLHKTVVAAEYMLVKILKRAKFLAEKGNELFAPQALKEFLYNKYSRKDFEKNQCLLEFFSELDDYDIYASVKAWCNSDDIILSYLCSSMVNRHLFHIELQNQEFSVEYMNKIKKMVAKKMKLQPDETDYFVFSDKVENKAYNPQSVKINILFRNGSIVDIAKASDQLNLSVLSKTVTKYFLCYPKDYKIVVNKM